MPDHPVRYQRVRWSHELDGEPIVIYSEIDAAGRELRKVEEYRDGRLDFADEHRHTGSTVLSETPLPRQVEINAQDEFDGGSMTRDAFDSVFERARAWFSDDEDEDRDRNDRSSEWKRAVTALGRIDR